MAIVKTLYKENEDMSVQEMIARFKAMGIEVKDRVMKKYRKEAKER